MNTDDLLQSKSWAELTDAERRWAAEHIGDEAEYTFRRSLIQATRRHYQAEAAQLVVPAFRRRPSGLNRLTAYRAPVWQMAASWLLIGLGVLAMWPKTTPLAAPQAKSVTVREVDTLYLTQVVRDTLVHFITKAVQPAPPPTAPRVETMADARGFEYLAQPAQRGMSWADDSLREGLVMPAVKD